MEYGSSEKIGVFIRQARRGRTSPKKRWPVPCKLAKRSSLPGRREYPTRHLRRLPHWQGNSPFLWTSCSMPDITRSLRTIRHQRPVFCMSNRSLLMHRTRMKRRKRPRCRFLWKARFKAGRGCRLDKAPPCRVSDRGGGGGVYPAPIFHENGRTRAELCRCCRHAYHDLRRHLYRKHPTLRGRALLLPLPAVILMLLVMVPYLLA